MLQHLLLVALAGWVNREQQQVIAYLQEENRILKKQLDGRRLRLTDRQRRRLAILGKALGRERLEEVASVVTPATILRWFQRLVAQKFDGSKKRGPGRPRVSGEIERWVVRIAEANPSYGYRRIQGALANFGYGIDASTVRNILLRNNIDPAPQRHSGPSWNQFIRTHWEILAAADFFTVEVATLKGLVTYYVLFVIDLSTRRVNIASVTPHPNEAFMLQCARQLTDPFDGFLLDQRYFIHDRDTKFTKAFDRVLRDSGVQPIILPPQSPNLNPFAARFVRSIKEECLSQIIVMGESSLRHVLQQYLVHYHAEKNHQGLGNRLIDPTNVISDGQIARRDRLGGLLTYYHRQAA